MLTNQAAPSTTRLSLILLSLVSLLALHLRTTTVIGTEVEAPLRADAGQYFAYAYNLRNHGVYSADAGGIGTDVAPLPDYFRNPGYPMLLLPFAGAAPSDASLLHATLLQAALSLGVVVLIFLAARSILPQSGALTVSLLTAISPHLINANVYILSETAASFTTVLFLLVFLRIGAQKHHPPAAWIACGILLALATLVRPTMQWFLFPALPLIWMISTPERPRKLAWFVGGFAITMAPWWVRNLIQFGELSNANLMIATLHHGMYPSFMFEGRPETFGFPYRFDPRSSEITQDLEAVLAEIGRRFLADPAEHLRWFLFGKPLMFWSWDNFAQGAGDVFIYPVTRTPFHTSLLLFATHETMRWLHWPLVALGMAGSILCWIPRVETILGKQSTAGFRVSGAILLYFVGLHMIGAPFPRYSIPILPLLYLQAVGALFLFRRMIRSAPCHQKESVNSQP